MPHMPFQDRAEEESTPSQSQGSLNTHVERDWVCRIGYVGIFSERPDDRYAVNGSGLSVICRLDYG